MFKKLDTLNENNIKKHFENKREKFNGWIINLHKQDCIVDKILRHTIGIKHKNGIYSKLKGTMAKHFHCNEPAHAYPLFKTHKLNKSKFLNKNIFEILIRLAQPAGNITTSRVTSFLEMLFKPISIKFCKYGVNEYCKDSKSYLEDLDLWKKNYHEII